MLKPQKNHTILLFIVIIFLSGCTTISFEQPKPYSEVISDTDTTLIGKAVGQWVDKHNGLSGFYPLIEGMDALGVRLKLAEQAEKSIDLQYFLMKDDTAGLVMTKALLNAADRGVRIRFLLDDIFTTSSDRLLLLINQHPNIQVRLFNPISRTGSANLNFLGDFKRANRRMHNKSFTVDNAISIVGGRNIADEYFQLKLDSVFVDFDSIAMGPIANEISHSFDQFWNHSRALPIDYVAKNKNKEFLAAVLTEEEQALNEVYDGVYEQAIESQLLQELMADRIFMFPAAAKVISDSPDKLINDISSENMQLANELQEILLKAKKEIIFLTPYYVPGKGGVEFMKTLIDKGVRVVVITNSLASNNHLVVHSAYSRYRKDVIKTGAEIYEARVNAAREMSGDEAGPNKLTMHTKLILIDRRYLFIGSLNLDPRSIQINAEMGVFIDSKEMAIALLADSEKNLSTLNYRVLVNEDNGLEWHTTIGGEKVVETSEPQTTAWTRFKAWFMKIAPESQM